MSAPAQGKGQRLWRLQGLLQGCLPCSTAQPCSSPPYARIPALPIPPWPLTLPNDRPTQSRPRFGRWGSCCCQRTGGISRLCAVRYKMQQQQRQQLGRQRRQNLAAAAATAPAAGRKGRSRRSQGSTCSARRSSGACWRWPSTGARTRRRQWTKRYACGASGALPACQDGWPALAGWLAGWCWPNRRSVLCCVAIRVLVRAQPAPTCRFSRPLAAASTCASRQRTACCPATRTACLGPACS